MVKILFQEIFDYIEDNFMLSKKKAVKTLNSRLKNDLKLLNEDDQLINKQLENGITERQMVYKQM